MLVTPLDITKYEELSKDDLKARIVRDVENTQSTAIEIPLPDLLLIRHDQYDLLQEDPDLFGAYESEQYMYRTPLNVMELRVKK